MKLRLGQILQQQFPTPLTLGTEQHGALMILDKPRQLFLIRAGAVGLSELWRWFQGGTRMRRRLLVRFEFERGIAA